MRPFLCLCVSVVTRMNILMMTLAVTLATQAGKDNVPDISGFWNNQYTPNLAQALGHEPPYTPQGLERWKSVDTKNDPTGLCLPVGPSRAFTAPFPVQIVQSPKMIAFLLDRKSTRLNSSHRCI